MSTDPKIGIIMAMCDKREGGSFIGQRTASRQYSHTYGPALSKNRNSLLGSSVSASKRITSIEVKVKIFSTQIIKSM